MNMNVTYPSSFTLVLSIMLVLALANTFLEIQESKGQLPPGPGRWPIIGNLFQMIMNRPAHQWIHRVMEDMETEIACFRFAGGVHVIIVTSSEISLEVLREKDKALADRAEAYSIRLISHGYNGVSFSSYGERWKLAKKVMVTKLLFIRLHYSRLPPFS